MEIFTSTQRQRRRRRRLETKLNDVTKLLFSSTRVCGAIDELWWNGFKRYLASQRDKSKLVLEKRATQKIDVCCDVAHKYHLLKSSVKLFTFSSGSKKGAFLCLTFESVSILGWNVGKGLFMSRLVWRAGGTQLTTTTTTTRTLRSARPFARWVRAQPCTTCRWTGPSKLHNLWIGKIGTSYEPNHEAFSCVDGAMICFKGVSCSAFLQTDKNYASRANAIFHKCLIIAPIYILDILLKSSMANQMTYTTCETQKFDATGLHITTTVNISLLLR